MKNYSRKFLWLAIHLMICSLAIAHNSSFAQTGSAGDSTISLQLKEINLTDALRTLSQQSKYNFVVESGVQGRVNLYLEKVKPLEALEILVKMYNLAYVRDGNTIMVFTEQTYQSVYGRKFRDLVQMRVFRLEHTKALEVSTQLASLKTKDGHIIVDSRTNSIIAFDVPETLGKYASVIDVLDLLVLTSVFDL